nr:immunoglobulin heavy chain junction region [Mus musculus]NSM05926.1 immunoglobulin heavy chain junction region [Mus musculus]NSM07819.1 immunoglobulin heavy chain junction region [Mus musculus]NSM09524.1 immunoglobulin heavy chain junction region [Mus musculus]
CARASYGSSFYWYFDVW